MDKIVQNSEENISVKLSENDYSLMLITLLVGILIIAIFVFFKKRSLDRKDFVLTGICESGKSVIFTQLLYSKFVDTFTSIVENVGEYECGNQSARVIDIPGHDRVREKFFDQYKSKAKGLIFAIDSVTVQKEIRDIADCLYNILSDSATYPCSVLVLCNKQDQPMAKSADAVRKLLEKEINVLRQTRSRKLKSVDKNDADKNVFLGKEGTDFNFADVTQNVEFVECSAKQNELNSLCDWIQRNL